MSTTPAVTEGPCGEPGSDRPPLTTSVSEKCATPAVMLIWVAGATTWNHVDFQARAAFKGHVWVLGPVKAGVWGGDHVSRVCGCPGSSQLPGTMLMPSGHAAAVTKLIRGACAARGTMVARVPQLQLGPFWVHGPCCSWGLW